MRPGILQHARTLQVLAHVLQVRARILQVLVLLALGLAASSGHAQQGRARLIIGELLPALELPRVGGGTLPLRSLRGRAVAISFFSRHCEPCRRELPTLERVLARVNQGRPQSKQVLGVVISLDSAAEAAAQARLMPGVRWLLDPGGKARQAFEPRTYPCTFLADGSGRVRHINRGFGRGYEARVERWLRGLLAADRSVP